MTPSPIASHLSGLFCGTLVCALILSGKIVVIGGLTFPASIILFPATFLISDILTEVYGYAAARRVVWLGLAVELFWIASYTVAAALPPASVWSGQAAFVETLEATPRIALGGMVAYMTGEFLNAYVLARLKVASRGRGLPLRLIVSTVVGAGADTIIVVAIAFGGLYPLQVLAAMVATVWGLKVAWEVAALPLSVPLICCLKRHERSDHFDRATDFNPFGRAGHPT